MILSNLEIQRALDEGRLVISPQPTPRSSAPNVKCPYQSTSVDLRLGDDISYLPIRSGEQCLAARIEGKARTHAVGS